MTQDHLEEMVEGFELSPQQRHVWLILHSHSASAYWARFDVKITGGLDREVLQEAVDILVDRHELLRTHFRCFPGTDLPLQVVLEEEGPSLAAPDATGATAEDLEAIMKEPVVTNMESKVLCIIKLFSSASGAHLLRIRMPALCADRATLHNLIDDLAHIYSTVKNGEELDDEVVQYIDYAQWQNELLEADEAEAGFQYWREKQWPAYLSAKMPFEDTHKPRIADALAAWEAPLPDDLLRAVEALAQEQGTSLSTMLLTCWSMLLRYLTGEEDVLVATSFSGRSDEELAGALGPFEKYLPLVLHEDGLAGLEDLIQHIASAQNAATEWMDYFCWDALLKDTDTEKAGYPFGFAYDDHPASREQGGLTWTVQKQNVQTEKISLKLTCLRNEDALTTRLSYDPERISAEDIVRIQAYYRNLLRAVTANPKAPHLWDILSPEETSQIVVDWNKTQVTFPDERLTHQWFEDQVLQTPDATAVIFHGAPLGFAELNARANAVAYRLQAMGLQPDDRVGLCLARCPDMIVSLLGILKAGGAYVILDPSRPKDNLHYIISDAAIQIVLTRQEWSHLLPEGRVHQVCLDDEPSIFLDETNENPPCRLSPDNLAYVIYTSGSTGRPKGVMISHFSLLRHMQWMDRVFAFDANDRVLQKTPLTFDASVWEWIAPLLSGGSLVLANENGHQDPDHLLEMMETYKVSILQVVPTLLQVMVVRRDLVDLPALRSVFCGGEALGPSLVQNFHNEAPQATLYNVYGPTEGTIHATYWPSKAGEQVDLVPIGKPIDNVCAYILDRYLKPIPNGMPGLLYISGAGLARGYLNLPRLTAEKFVPNPFEDGRLYQTGDLARRLPDGQIEILGRIDYQVKLRGFRIELGEIESLLGELSGINGAVALVREDEPDQEQLVAYVQSTERTADDVSALRDHLVATLPHYSVPAHIVVLPTWPLLPNGKIDRKSLPAPDGARRAKHAYVAPRGPVEEKLAAIWAELLGIDRVGINDNFFELGGDSILSIQMASRANLEELQVTARQLFEHQTIAELANDVTFGPGTEVEQGLVSGDVHFTPIALDFFSRGLKTPHHYNQAVLVSMNHQPDRSALEGALSEVVAHHDALRMVYPKTDGVRRQYIEEKSTAALQYHDLAGRADQDAARQDLIAEIQGAFDLEQGPLIRLAWFDYGSERDGHLLMVLHHLVVDGVSWRILMEDLVTVYEQLAAGSGVYLQPKTTSIQTWAQHLHDYAASQKAKKDLAFWSHLETAGVHPLPRELEGDNLVAHAETVSVELTEQQTRTLLQEVPSAYHTHVNEVLLTALGLAVRHWTGPRALTIELEGHGREDLFDDVNLARTVGWFTSLYPVCLDLNKVSEAEPGASLMQVKELLRAVPDGGIGFGIRRQLCPGEGDADYPRPEISFNYLGQFDLMPLRESIFEMCDEYAGPLHGPNDERLHLLEISGAVVEGRLRLSCTYSNRVHRRETMETLLNNYTRGLSVLCDHCLTAEAGGYTPSDFPDASLTDAELNDLTEQLDVTHKPGELLAIYPLSPLQQGLLFHSLLSPESGVYVVQITCELRGFLDTTAFRAAWEQAVELHGVFRTSFHNLDTPHPLQVVHREVPLTWETRDWRDLDEAEQEQRFQEMVSEDRRMGFDPGKAPLMRIWLARVSEYRHRLLWSHQHAILDGWSLAQVLKDLFASYEALSHGQTPVVEPVRPFRDYIMWLEHGNKEEAGEFWKTFLKGFTDPTSLVVDRKTRSGGHDEVAPVEIEHELPAVLTGDLKEWARAERLTLNVLTQGAWALLLNRYGGESDVVFGTIVSGRPAELKGIEAMVGPFINTVPMRASVDRSQDVLSFLRNLHRAQVERESYSYTPLFEIQRYSELSANVPLFESLLAFENYPVSGALRSGESGLEVHDIRSLEQTNYPFTLMIEPGERLKLRIIYDSHRFEEKSILRLINHYSTLLSEIITHSDQTPMGLSILSEEERHRAMVTWNDTEAPYPDQCIHELIAEQVARTPEAPALFFEDSQWTYRQIDEQARALGHHLRELGATPNKLIAIVLEKGWEQVVATLGILYSGAAYLPIDPSWPKDRRTHLLDYGQADLVLTNAAFRDTMEWPADVSCIVVEEREPVGPLKTVQRPEDLAYVIFTSGSTGLPKGVVIDNRGPVNTSVDMNRRFGVNAEDRVLALSSLCFDLSVYDLFGLLMSGGAIVMPNEEGVRNPAIWWDLVLRHGVTLWDTVPALMQLMVDFLDGREQVEAGPIRAVIMSGDWIPVTLPDRIRKYFPHANVCSFGGATEASIWSITYPIGKVDPEWTSIPYGMAMDNQKFYVLDEALEPCPPGVPGNLHIGGIGLALGYWRDEERTNASFITHPRSGERMYRTGDLGRYFDDGNIEFLGRADFQVKVNGYRIELGEIEHVLKAHPEVLESVTVVREDQPGVRRLVSYVTPKADIAPAQDELYALLEAKLPEYMVPAHVLLLPDFPLTANGKVNRKALPAPSQTERVAEAQAAPMTLIEQLLAGIWSDILDVDQIGPRDNFFELGGHSLLATQVLARIRDTFSTTLPLGDLFEAPTLADLADRVQFARAAAEGDQSGPVLEPVPRTEDLPLSFAQQRLWFLDQFEGAGPTYHISASWRFEGSLCPATLSRCLQEVVARHESLRTHFAEVDGQPVQRFAQAVDMPLPVVDLSTVADLSHATVQSLLDDGARRGFNLSTDLLIRALVLRLGPEEHVLQVVMHHIVSDGWSMGVLLREFATLYQAYVQGNTYSLDTLPIQYADFAQWQRQELEGARLESQLDFWSNSLEGAPPLLALPLDHPRPARFSFKGAAIAFSLDQDLTDRLMAFSRHHGATPYMVMLATYKILLYRYSGQKNVVTGTTVANRTRRELEDLIGFFVNVLVLHTDLNAVDDGEELNFTQLLARVRAHTLAAYSQQDVPFEQLVERIQPKRSLSHTPLFQAMFSYQNMPLGSMPLPGLDVNHIKQDSVSAKFDLNLLINETSSGITGEVEYYAEIFNHATIARLLDHYRTLLESVLDDPDQALSRLPMLTSEETHRVLTVWNDTETEFPKGRLLHQPFFEQARRNPEATAVLQDGLETNYGSLATQATAIARDLSTHGASPNHLIAIFLDKGPDQIAAALGINLAGGAYLPIDTSWPDDRRLYLLEVGEVIQVLTDRHRAENLEWPANVRCLVAEDYRNAAEETNDLATAAVGPSDLAYVIFTSGSTGRPKGVSIEHRAALNTIDDINSRFEVGPEDRVLGLSSLSFDLSVYDLFGILAAGGCLVLPNLAGLKEPGHWAELVMRENITLWDTVPTLMEMLVDALEHRPDLTAEGEPTLRLVMMSGDWIPLSLPDRIKALFARAAVYSLGGATEASIWSIHYPIGEISPKWNSVPYGRPLANQRFYVLNDGLEPCPVNVTGLLYIGGVGLARGYWRDEERTNASFITHPKTGERLYRTGDMGRYYEDGNIEFLGRADFQVKIRGYRIELGEIEVNLNRHETITEAVVIVREDKPGDKRLAAYVIPPPDAVIDNQTLRDHLAVNLPEYMVPHIFETLTRFPLSSNGKVNRSALAAMPLSTLEDREVVPERALPRTPSEELLTAIWAQVLELEHIGTDANFFDLGGHSLLATRVITRIRERLGVELPVQLIFEQPTVAEIARHLDTALGKQRHEGPALEPVPRDDASPLSFAQQRMWFLAQWESDAAAYNIPLTLELRGPVNVDALRDGLREIMRRHEALRTHFAETDSGPVQIISDNIEPVFELIDLTHLSVEEGYQVACQRAQVEVTRSFDLQTGPLIRTALIRLTQQRHIFAASMHHIVSDAWSMGIWLRELVTLYAASLDNESFSLPELPVQYADFVHWQRRWLVDERLALQLTYWQDALKGLPPRLELPTDRPRPARQSFRGAKQHLQLSQNLSTDLAQLGREQGTTLFMTLLAAWQLLLARYSGQRDLAVGIPIANRSHPNLEHLIGFFVNTLVIRADLKDEPDFVSFLQQIRERTLAAYAHEDLPFEQLVEALQPERDPSHTPLFQVAFALQSVPLGALELPELTLSPLDVQSDTAKFDLTLSLDETGEGLQGFLEYNTDLFDPATIDRLVAHFEILLTELTSNPAQSTATVNYLTDEERHTLCHVWNGQPSDYPNDQTIAALFEAQTHTLPNHIAVEDENTSLNYAALNARAESVGRQLRAHGVGADTLVGLCCERSVEMMIGLLGILKAGGAYLPLDAGYPTERLAFMLEDAAPVLILVQDNFKDTLPATEVPTLSLDSLSNGETSGDEPLSRLARPENAAYVMYTSGSTGRPKGIIATQRSVVRLVKQTNYVQLDQNETVLCYAPLAFDASTFEIWGALLNGARLVTAPTAALSPEEFGTFLKQKQVTTAWLTAALFQQQVDLYPEGLDGLRQLLAGGDVLPPAHVRKLLERDTGLRLINGYGPTENTTFTCCHPMTSATHIVDTVPIGKPIANSRVLILDDHLHPVPTGVFGELFAAGDGLARAYHRRPAGTAERFIPNPYAEIPGDRLYRTGDLACFLSDGRVAFGGRRDQQVKLRGFRIELGEIEWSLNHIDGVRQAVVILRPGNDDEKRLIAYIVSEEERGIDEATLRDRLRGSLPGYMLPQFFVFLEHFPTDPNGKIDRKALPNPDGEMVSVRTYVAPRGETETLLADIWADLLDTSCIGSTDNFFESGGHSLLATRVTSRVRDVFGIDLPLKTFFDHPVLQDLAAQVEKATVEGSGLSEPPMVAGERQKHTVLSFAQERLWFLERLQPGDAYNMPDVFRLSGALDVGRLRRVLETIIARHESLRTRFIAVEGMPYQVIDEEGELHMRVTDLRDLAENEREDAARDVVQEELQKPFDLEAGPLLSVLLIQLNDNTAIMVLNMHHIIGDGWSLRVLFAEISALYRSDLLEETAEVAALPIQYPDFAVWQRGWLKDDVLEQLLSWWEDQLQDTAHALELPYDYPRPSLQTYNGDFLPFQLEPEASEAVNALCRRSSVTPFMFFNAAFAVLLYRYSHQTNFCIGTPIANRNRTMIEGLIGFFVNSLVLRADLSGDPDFETLLDRTRRISLDAFAHQDAPFEQIVSRIQPERDMSRAPLFQVMFSYQNLGIGDDVIEIPDLSVAHEKFAYKIAKYDLTLNMAGEGGAFSGGFEYNTDLFKPETIQRMSVHFRNIIEKLTAQPDRPLSAMSVLGADERQMILTEWSGTSVDYQSDKCFHRLFEERVTRTPSAEALVWGETRLTYDEVNRHANRLARRLRDMGVGCNISVGLCMYPGSDVIIAMLATFKAGGAYLPLDPGYPMDRLDHMIEDSGAQVLINGASLTDIPMPEDRIIQWTGDWSTLAHYDDSNLTVKEDVRQTAYVIYTSGSTGLPKGVAVGHDAMVNFCQGMVGLFGIRPGERLIQFMSLNFDFSTEEIFPTLLGGATLINRPSHHALSVLELADLVTRESITVLLLPTAFWHELTRVLEESGRALPESLRLLVVGGEEPKADMLQQWQELTHHRLAFFNGYGPTEATVCALGKMIAPKETLPIGKIPVGRPLPNYRVYVLDSALSPVPIGIPGEIFIGGPVLARGYLNQPARTGEVFVPNPFAEGGTGERLYKTGDLARRLPNGELVFLGRRDFQVKIRGFRVEPGEVERTLARHPAIAEVTVIAHSSNGSTSLAAYYVGKESVTSSELRAYLAGCLPGPMVPSAYMALEAMPLTRSGKVDQRALPAPTTGLSGEAYLPPSTVTENELAGIWAEFLGQEKIGREDSFFDLGGHSLIATQVIVRIRDRLGVELPLLAIFENARLTQLAEHIDDLLKRDTLLDKITDTDDLSDESDDVEVWNI